MEDVSMNTTSAIMHSPYAIAVHTPPVPSPDAGFLLASIFPANGLDTRNLPKATHDTYVDKAEAGLHVLQVISRGIEASVKRSPENESERAIEPSLNPSNAVPGQPKHGQDLPLTGTQEELLVEAANIERSDEHSLYRKGPASPVLANHEPTDVADAKRPIQEAVTTTEKNVLLCSPASLAALTPPKPCLR
ncbi:hypothetical protein AX14_010107 [Amanita brunnescens Koide BX004]|nr:hypothetical protein AX14_010107 [Amanita brunnescens Koide BX004]